MPGYRTHRTINLVALAAFAAAGTRHFAPGLVGVFAVSYGVATFFLSPDLDLKHSSPTRNWGPLRWLWRPYQVLFKHRGWSHSLLFSSATRVAYLVGVLAALLCLAQFAAGEALAAENPDAFVAPLAAHRLDLAAAGAGILLSDAAHILADRLGSALKALF